MFLLLTAILTTTPPCEIEAGQAFVHIARDFEGHHAKGTGKSSYNKGIYLVDKEGELSTGQPVPSFYTDNGTYLGAKLSLPPEWREGKPQSKSNFFLFPNIFVDWGRTPVGHAQHMDRVSVFECLGRTIRHTDSLPEADFGDPIYFIMRNPDKKEGRQELQLDIIYFYGGHGPSIEFFVDKAGKISGYKEQRYKLVQQDAKN